MQKWEWALLLGMVGTVCCSALAGTAQSYGSLEQNVLRLHILANSDSIDDQALKLKVRDKVLAQTETLFRSQPENAADAEQLIAEHLETLEQTAQQLVWDEDIPMQSRHSWWKCPLTTALTGNGPCRQGTMRLCGSPSAKPQDRTGGA